MIEDGLDEFENAHLNEKSCRFMLFFRKFHTLEVLFGKIEQKTRMSEMNYDMQLVNMLLFPITFKKWLISRYFSRYSL